MEFCYHITMNKLTGAQIPEPLKHIPDPPKQLWIEGELPSFEEYTYLAVVGSRKYSTYGKEACETLLAGLAGMPIVIVSGLAIGIDSIAHQAALNAGLSTVAVPGSGLGREVLYPRQNIQLAEEILKAGGALLSENPPDFRPYPHSFPERNRIMTGLAQAVLVIEATERSGTLITARMAVDYNRTLLAVPGSIFNPSSMGANRLLKQGAAPVCSSSDIISELGLETSLKQEPLDMAALGENERKVLELLYKPLSRDELLRALGIPISQANALLIMMEIKGLIKESLGEMRPA